MVVPKVEAKVALKEGDHYHYTQLSIGHGIIYCKSHCISNTIITIKHVTLAVSCVMETATIKKTDKPKRKKKSTRINVPLSPCHSCFRNVILILLNRAETSIFPFLGQIYQFAKTLPM